MDPGAAVARLCDGEGPTAGGDPATSGEAVAVATGNLVVGGEPEVSGWFMRGEPVASGDLDTGVAEVAAAGEAEGARGEAEVAARGEADGLGWAARGTI